MSFGGSSPSVASVPTAPPAASAATLANSQAQSIGAESAARAAAAGGMGFTNTLLTGSQGAAAPSTATPTAGEAGITKPLLGS
jgi:hypothetical protein